MRSSLTHTEALISEIVAGLLPEASPKVDVAREESLIGAGLSSIDMVNLLLQIESRFNVTVPSRAVTPTNFYSIASIAKIIEQITSKAA